MFWMPAGWLPAYVEWLLAFPRAPRGAVSIQVWGIACASVIALASEAVVAVWALRADGAAEGARKRKREQPMGVGAGGGRGQDGRGREKKEL